MGSWVSRCRRSRIRGRMHTTRLLLWPLYAVSATILLFGQGNFADSEVPTGPVNGFNTKFALVHVPNPITSVALYRNGIRQRQCPSCDFRLTVNGTVATIVFNQCCAPAVGDTLIADYRY